MFPTHLSHHRKAGLRSILQSQTRNNLDYLFFTMPMKLLVPKCPKVDISVGVVVDSLTISYVLVLNLTKIIAIVRVVDVYYCIPSCFYVKPESTGLLHLPEPLSEPLKLGAELSSKVLGPHNLIQNKLINDQLCL